LRRKAKRCLAGALLFSGTCLLAVSSSTCMSSVPYQEPSWMDGDKCLVC
jgi:hypothetical protein